MREIRTSGSEGGGTQTNESSLPLSIRRPPGYEADQSETTILVLDRFLPAC